MQKKIFPWIEESEKILGENLRNESLPEEERKELAGSGFLKFMKYLRIVILQDAAEMLENVKLILKLGRI